MDIFWAHAGSCVDWQDDIRRGLEKKLFEEGREDTGLQFKGRVRCRIKVQQRLRDCNGALIDVCAGGCGLGCRWRSYETDEIDC